MAKVKHRNTNARAGRPGPTKLFHRFNEDKRMPTSDTFCTEHKGGIRTSHSINQNYTLKHKHTGVQMYLLLVQGQWNRSINSTNITTRQPSKYIVTTNHREIMTSRWIEPKEQLQSQTHRNTNVLAVVRRQSRPFIDSTKINAHRPSPF